MKMEQDQGEWASNIMGIAVFAFNGIFGIVVSILGHLGLWPGAPEFPWWATAQAAGAGVFFLVMAVVWFRMHRKMFSKDS